MAVLQLFTLISLLSTLCQHITSTRNWTQRRVPDHPFTAWYGSSNSTDLWKPPPHIRLMTWGPLLCRILFLMFVRPPMYMVQLWSNYGPTMVQLWPNYGPTMVQLWPNYGLTIVQLWSTMVQLWSNHGPTLLILSHYCSLIINTVRYIYYVNIGVNMAPYVVYLCVYIEYLQDCWNVIYTPNIQLCIVPIYPIIHPSIYLSTQLSIHLFNYSCTHLSTYLFLIFLCHHLFFNSSSLLSHIYPFTHLFVYLIRLSIYIYLSI